MQLRNNHRLMRKIRRNKKYYLCYSKPPVLDIKWENCDINIVELASISKFSKLDGIGIPLRLLNYSLIMH